MSLSDCINEVIKTYDRMRKANQNYLIENSGLDGFLELVDNRSMYFDDLEITRGEILKELRQAGITADYSSKELPEILKDIPMHFPELKSLHIKLIDSLEQLVKSENNVYESIEAERDDVKQQILQARKSHKTLSAYKPLTGYSGSHFFDQKK